MTCRNALFAAIVCLTLYSASAAGQTTQCIVASAEDGESVRFAAKMFPTGHDVLIRPVRCPDIAIVLVYGDDTTLGDAKLALRRDSAFGELERFSYAERKSSPDHECRLCFLYQVTADFEGRLDVTPAAGWKRDPSTGRVTGIDGFGHPLPFTRYRLVMTGVSNVQAVERPQKTTPDSPRN